MARDLTPRHGEFWGRRALWCRDHPKLCSVCVRVRNRTYKIIGKSTVLKTSRPFPESLTSLGEYAALVTEGVYYYHARRMNMDKMETTVPVKSAWSSTINWAAFTSMLVGVASVFNLPLDATKVNTVMAAMPVLIGAYTYMKNTWFSARVLAPSVPK